jgi:hypothetical protein
MDSLPTRELTTMKAIACTWLILLAPACGARAGSLTNAVPVTTNLVFELKAERGPVTNRFGADDTIIYALVATSTNDVHYRALPFDQAFEFRLFDAAGQEVPKTPRGQKSGQPPTAPKGRGGLSRFKPQSVRYEPRKLFRPSEMFLATSNGVY